MDKLTHRSWKRKRSSSRDRLPGSRATEDKLSQVISVLSEGGVKTPRVPPSSSPLSSSLAYQAINSFSEDLVRNITEICVPHDSGVYEHLSSVYQTEESTQFFPTNRNISSSFAAITEGPSVRETLPSSSPAKTIVLKEPAAPTAADTDESLGGHARQGFVRYRRRGCCLPALEWTSLFRGGMIWLIKVSPRTNGRFYLENMLLQRI